MADLAVNESASADVIRSRIFTIRGVQVMLDRDLATLYGVTTGALNQAVKRNKSRFPERFMFQMNKTEAENLKSQPVISSWGGSRSYPYANSLTVMTSDNFHDRFLIIDKTTLIHVGASLNHLGKKCFAFSSLDKSNIPDILAKI